MSDDFLLKLQHWAQQFEVTAWYEGNSETYDYQSFDQMLGVNAVSELISHYNGGFEKLKTYVDQTQDYLLGYLGYDLKNDVEALTSANFDGLDFADIHFFQPEKLFIIHNDDISLCYHNSNAESIETDLRVIENYTLTAQQFLPKSVKISQRVSKEKYIKNIETIRQHLFRGDTYEVNYCMEFFAENVQIHPLSVYLSLQQRAQAPFATFIKLYDKYILSTSPERYLRKDGITIISQPIKGTRKRGTTAQEDQDLINELQRHPKEVAENIMVVDLVRNDLSITASKGSVKVEELCKIYSFNTVHQMISTVKSSIATDVHPVDVLKTTFPMASMTGVPKISTMKIIEKVETTKRGVFSGAIGYFTPEKNFDFNVVIRTLLYNATKKYLSFSVGSAITEQADAQQEYEECLQKVAHIHQLFDNQQTTNLE